MTAESIIRNNGARDILLKTKSIIGRRCIENGHFFHASRRLHGELTGMACIKKLSTSHKIDRADYSVTQGSAAAASIRCS
jgi:hypothetical protein